MEIKIRELAQVLGSKQNLGHDFKEILVCNGILDKKSISIQQTMEVPACVLMSIRQAEKVVTALNKAITAAKIEAKRKPL